MPGVSDGEGTMEAHRQVDAHQSRYPLPLPRPRSNCPLLPKRGSLQRGRAREQGGRERGGGIKSRRREDARLGQRVQPQQHDGGVAPCATRNARGASGKTLSRGRGVWKATLRHHWSLREGQFRWHQRQQ